jgi:beta-N-acetylhexosaminidase
MLDLAGTALTDEERAMLRHPMCGGVILFTRNFESVGQLADLVREIHALREPRLLVAVDHEGGRVQRFRQGFTHLPPARVFGEAYDREHAEGRRLAEEAGWLMAAELRAVGVDFSFAPVLDLGRGVSGVIGDRAFHRDPEAVADLAHHYMAGMQQAGMAAVGKHFPGHGGVREDSHLTLPVDERPLERILEEDLLPFERMVHFGIAGIMPAHVVYPLADPQPAGFSAFWLQGVLRDRLGFSGVIFSDDLSMGGATAAGGYAERARVALHAGCDMVLVCNHPEGACEVLDGIGPYDNPVAGARLARMHGRKGQPMGELRESERWMQAAQRMNELDDSPWLELGV